MLSKGWEGAPAAKLELGKLKQVWRHVWVPMDVLHILLVLPGPSESGVTCVGRTPVYF